MRKTFTPEEVDRIEENAYQFGVEVGRREALENLDEMRRLSELAGEYEHTPRP